jgi:uncharacterized membrane protein YphA (DoxX/SURF4 family)
VVVWLFRLLLFRLMFFSGYVKLASGDPSWHNLTAMFFHYHTQPLPMPLAWYADQLPAWFQRGTTAVVLAIELGAPFLVFLPRRPRIAGAAFLAGLQILILLTGNYAFFNWLTIALCVLLLDDQFFERALRRGHIVRARISLGRSVRITLAALTTLILPLNIGQFKRLFFGDTEGPLSDLAHFAEPLGIVNSYGLFAVMTTTRPEIVIQGSRDGGTWLDYSFRYKPGDLNRGMPVIAPFQPRLDWQMWFAALGSYRDNAWFGNLMVRLLQGSPQATRLFERAPFGRTPPRYVRALLYQYTFTSFTDHRATGAWWKRELLGTYFPAISLDDVKLQ